MRCTTRATSRVFTGLAIASALCLPAAAIAAQFDFYIKLPPIEGETSDDKHKNQIEILSYSWGATQTGSFGHGGGGGAGKVSMQDISAPSATSGASKDMTLKRSRIGENAAAGEAEITLKGNAGTGGAGKRTPPTVTLKRGAAAEQASGVRVAVGDVTGDGSPGVAEYNPKELTVSKRVAWNSGQPAPTGSVTVRGKFPGCRVGTRYPSLELGGAAAHYTLRDVIITSCASASAGGESLPMEEVSFNYAKIEH